MRSTDVTLEIHSRLKSNCQKITLGWFLVLAIMTNCSREHQSIFVDVNQHFSSSFWQPGLHLPSPLLSLLRTPFLKVLAPCQRLVKEFTYLANYCRLEAPQGILTTAMAFADLNEQKMASDSDFHVTILGFHHPNKDQLSTIFLLSVIVFDSSSSLGKI